MPPKLENLDRHRNGGAGEHGGFAKSACVIRRNKTAFQYHTFCVVRLGMVLQPVREGCMEVIDQLCAVVEREIIVGWIAARMPITRAAASLPVVV